MTPAVDRAVWPHAPVFRRCACGELDAYPAIPDGYDGWWRF